MQTSLEQLGIEGETIDKYGITIVDQNAAKLILGYSIASPNQDLLEELAFLSGKQIELASLDAVDQPAPVAASQVTTDLDLSAGNFLSSLIQDAFSQNSSDIHIESYKQVARIRLRIDGQLIERATIPLSDYPAMVNQIKIAAELDIAEKRLPQDGRIHFNEDGNSFDLRVSSLPTLSGEKIVLRILKQDQKRLDIERLGFAAPDLEHFKSALQKPHGLILISGPTGSGKTTTLYSGLKLLNRTATNIVTIEDPIEYTLEGVNQVQLREDIGLGFTEALRAFLRQDPDIIMLGEIRDAKTAQMAVRAALTGHLVLSTIHTNSAWGTVDRLKDMGVPGFLLAATLNLSVAQRLVRLLCEDCKTISKQTLPDDDRRNDDFRGSIYQAAGCSSCFQSGYKGRTAIYEVLPITGELAKIIKSEDLSEAPSQLPYTTLKSSALELVKEGKTSLEEVYELL